MVMKFIVMLGLDSCISCLFLVGGRKADDIVAWVTRNSGPSLATLATLQEAQDQVEKNEVSVIGYFDSLESEEAKAYEAAADSLADAVTFGVSTVKEVMEGMEASANTVVLYKKVCYCTVCVNFFLYFNIIAIYIYIYIYIYICIYKYIII